MKVDRNTLGILSFCFASSIISTLQDFVLVENANFMISTVIPPRDWVNIVGGASLYIRAVVCLAVAGPIIDNLNSLRLLAVAFGVSALTTILFSASDSFAVLFILRVVYSFPVSIFYPLLCAIAYSNLHEDLYAIANGVIIAGTCSSDGLSVILELIFTTHWRGSFYISAMLMSLLAIVCLIVPGSIGRRDEQTSSQRRIGAEPWDTVFSEMLKTYRRFGRMMVSSPALLGGVCILGIQGLLYSSTTLTQLWLHNDMGLERSYVASKMIPMPFAMVGMRRSRYAAQPICRQRNVGMTRTLMRTRHTVPCYFPTTLLCSYTDVDPLVLSPRHRVWHRVSVHC